MLQMSEAETLVLINYII